MNIDNIIITSKISSEDNTVSFSSFEKLPIGREIKIDDTQYTVSYVNYSYLTKQYQYTAVNTAQYTLQKLVFTELYQLEVENFIEFFSRYVKIESDILDNVSINIAVNGENYYTALLRICEIYSYYVIIINNVIHIIQSENVFNNRLVDIKVLSVESDAYNLANKLYFLSEEFNFTLSQVSDSMLKSVNNLLYEDQKGLYLLDSLSSAEYGLIEKNQIVNEFSMNNLSNEEWEHNIQITLLLAYNRLKKISKPQKIYQTSPKKIVSIDEILIGDIVLIDDEKVLVDQITYQKVGDEYIVNVQLANIATENQGIASLLRQINRRNNTARDTQVYTISLSADELSNAQSTQDIKLDYKTINNVEMNIEVNSQDDIQMSDVVLSINDINVFYVLDYTVPGDSTKYIRVPLNQNVSLVNTPLYDEVLKEFQIQLSNTSQSRVDVKINIIIKGSI